MSAVRNVLVTLLVFGATAATAAAAPAPATLPPARAPDAILTDIVKAIGGAAAIERHKSLHAKMTITFQGLDITGTADHYAAAGDKSLVTTAIPNIASTREGTDGVRAWSEDPINGLRILDGIEAEQARIQAAWNAELRMKDLFPKIEAKNEIDENGKRLECLILTPKIGPPATDCFDAETHLMVVQRWTRSGPQGDMPFTARLKDWRVVSDLKMPFVTEMQIGPVAYVGKVTSVELDVPVDAAMFATPIAPSATSGAAEDGVGKANAGKANAGKAKTKGGAKGRSGTAKPATGGSPKTPAAPAPAH